MYYALFGVEYYLKSNTSSSMSVFGFKTFFIGVMDEL